MRNLHRPAVLGLLWLAFSAASFATTLNITGHPQTEPTGGGGGEFTAYLDNNVNATFNVFCVDYLNFISGIPTSITVNVDTLPNVADTRYGTTLAASFSNYKGVGTDPNAGSAVERYTLAAYLTTLYNFTPGNDAANSAIQDAIWNLLDTNGAVNSQGASSVAAITADVQTAVNWYTNAGNAAAVADLQSRTRIFSDVKIDNPAYNGCSSRYNCGAQEYLTVLPGVPEPQTFALLGGGLLALGMLRRRKK